MRYCIDSCLRLSDVPEGLFDQLRARMTVPNPDYLNLVRMGKPVWNVPKDIMLYEIRQNELLLPRGMATEVWQQRPSNTHRVDGMCRGEPLVWPEGSITLRDYQQAAFDLVLHHREPQGVVVMPCGGGKTETGLAIARAIGKPVLWIAHTIDLCQQARLRALDRLGLDEQQVGMLGGGENRMGSHITFATIQTLYTMDLEPLANTIGTVIVDECQHVCANPTKAQMFNTVLGMLPAYHRYGLTATPSRGDGLENTIHMILGPRLVEVTQEQVEAEGGTVIPTVQPVHTSFTYKPGSRERTSIDFSRLRRHMAENWSRTQYILNFISAELEVGKSCIVLGSTLALLEQMHEAVSGAGYASRYVCGATKGKERAAALREMREGQAQVMFATYQLAKEGLDIPRADRLFFAQPVRDKVAVQQSVGRIMRPAPGKTDALVYDFVDSRVPTCKSQFTARKTVYRKLKCDIKEEIL